MAASSYTPSAASAVSGNAPPHVVEDCFGVLQLLSDGTVTRSTATSILPTPPAAPSDLHVQWKDVVYDAVHNLRLRMYKPSADIANGAKRLPVLVYFHGGGFCICSFEVPNFHTCCLRLAAEIPAIVLSADYRLAPEHRLPAAHDDSEALFSWLRGQAAVAGSDPWLAESADFGRVFFSGDSAGGNIAHHVAVRLGSARICREPVQIAGYVLLWPYFGGEMRTVSEAECLDKVFWTLARYDQMWRLALPVGATRDHPAANPFGPESPVLNPVALPPMLVVNPELDMLHDRITDYVTRLKAMAKPVELVEFKGKGHGFFVLDPWGEAADELLRVVKRFMHAV